jgi:hypothetical protein
LQYFQTVANGILVGPICTLTTAAFTAQRPLSTFSLKILLFEHTIALTVLTWQLLTSDFWLFGHMKAALAG